MNLQTRPQIDVPTSLVEAIRALPLEREVEHCGSRFVVSPFETYARCPQCGREIKLRSFSALVELEDVFDAVFEWLFQPGAEELMKRRQKMIRANREDDD